MENNEIIFEIVEQIGVIAKYPTGWQKELNRVSWNGGEPKYDIRDWNEEHDHMSRGITLSEIDMKKVREMLDERDCKDKSKEPKAQVINTKEKKKEDRER